MNKMNKQFNKKELDLLKLIVNTNINKIVHDEFIYTNTSFGHVNIISNNNIYELKCSIDNFYYFGDPEDVAVLSFNEVNEKDVKSELSDHKQTETKINDTLLNVDVINESQYVKIGNKEYLYEYTKGIILYFNNIEYGFKMSSWFSEIIEIHKGCNLIDKFKDHKRFKESFKLADAVEVTSNIVRL